MAVKVKRIIDGQLYTRVVGRRGTLVLDEAIRVLRVSRRTIFHLIRRRLLRPRRVGRRLRFPVGEVLKVRDRRGGTGSGKAEV